MIARVATILALLAAAAGGHSHHHRHLKRKSDGNDEVADRPGFFSGWNNETIGEPSWSLPIWAMEKYGDQKGFIDSGARCAYKERSIDEEKTFDDLFKHWKDAIETGKKKGWRDGRRLEAVTVPTYFHIMTDGNKGDVFDWQIDEQMGVLNDAFAKAGFVFLLQDQGGKKASRTNRKKWFQGKEESKYKAQLRKGGKNALNVYLNQAKGYLGYAYYPSDSMAGSTLDGVVVLYGAMPNGFASPYNEGDTLIHEVGHWLGLPHTFNGGCNKNPNAGDGISDTPAEASPAFGCPIGRDSCKGPGFEGLDPVTNFMDYSDDACMDEFTNDQIKRMHASWDLFRDIGEDDVITGQGGGNDEDEEKPTTSPTEQPSAKPVAAEVCDASGSPCRNKKLCCSGKCRGKKGKKKCR